MVEYVWSPARALVTVMLSPGLERAFIRSQDDVLVEDLSWGVRLVSPDGGDRTFEFARTGHHDKIPLGVMTER